MMMAERRVLMTEDGKMQRHAENNETVRKTARNEAISKTLISTVFAST